MKKSQRRHNSALNLYTISQIRNSINAKINMKEANNTKLLKIISDVLTNICKEMKSNNEEKLNLIKPFMLKKLPSITIYEFIERLSKYSEVSDETFILTLIYIDKICLFYNLNLNYYIIYKLLLASFMASSKYHEDTSYSTQFYAKLGGVSVKEVIYLEYEFMKLIDFNLFVKEELFNKYKSNLKNVEDDY